MEKLKRFFKKLREGYRKRKLYKLAEADAFMMCGRSFHILPAEIYIKGDKETMLRETRRIGNRYKYNANEWFLDEWPLDDEEEEN
ncbi:MAG: hypothetical protein NC123_10990 [Butyrivibrio sp.]|nr:hypothetical protein [Acetatifactor muris]MCM1560054.1 hypothetical protein [Butyrivibrio sp.]